MFFQFFRTDSAGTPEVYSRPLASIIEGSFFYLLFVLKITFLYIYIYFYIYTNLIFLINISDCQNYENMARRLSKSKERVKKSLPYRIQEGLHIEQKYFDLVKKEAIRIAFVYVTEGMLNFF
jgi:hypothetical protein